MTRLKVPARAHRAVRLSAEAFSEGGRVLSAKLVHMRERDGALICGEGEEEVAALPQGTGKLFYAGGQLFAYLTTKQYFELIGTALRRAADDTVFRLVHVPLKEGGGCFFAVSDGQLQQFDATDAYTYNYGNNLSDTGVALFHERLFAAKGDRLSVTACDDFEDWVNHAEQGPGYFELPSPGGKIADLAVLRGALYLFRERGITKVEGCADVFAFRAEEMTCHCGRIAPHSVCVCGGEAYFFTENGLCRFDGTRAERAPGAADGEIDFSSVSRPERYRNGILARVALRAGGSALYAYDAFYRRGRFINLPCELCAADGEAYIAREGTIYRLTDAPTLPAGGAMVELVLTFSDLGDSEKRTEAVVLEGCGTFAVRAFGENGRMGEACGRTGERLPLNRAVLGETVRLQLIPQSADCALRSATLYVGREERI